MTVPVNPNPRTEAVGNGVTVAFPFGFLCIEARDISVSVSGAVVPQSQYTVTGLGLQQGGTVTFVSPPAAGAPILMILDVVAARDTNYQDYGDLFAQTVNKDFDRLWLAIQGALGSLGRSLQLGLYDIDGQGSYRARGNRIQDLADPIANQDAVNLRTALLMDTAVRDYAELLVGSIQTPSFQSYTPVTLRDGVDYTSGTSTSVSLPSSIAGRTISGVFFDSAFQSPTTYTLSSDGLTLTFDGAVPLGVGEINVAFYAPSLLGMFQQTGLGAISRTWQSKAREHVSVYDFGAVGAGGVDDTVAINRALQAAFFLKRPLDLGCGTFTVSDTTGKGYALFNPGVSLYGAGKQNTMIVPAASHPNSSHIMMIKPAANVALDFLYMRDFMIFPGASGTKRGASCLYFDTRASGVNAGCVQLDGLHLLPGNDYSIQWVNDGAVNAQGNPSNSKIERCSIWEGMAFFDAGDNIRIVDNAILSSEGSFHVGIVYNGVHHAGGVPAGLHVARNASNCDGGFILFRGGHMLVVEDNNYEQSKGGGTGNGAIIDIQGDIAQCGGGRISGNAFGVFGTTTASSVIRVANAVGMRVDQNRILSGITLAYGVVVTSQAQETQVGVNAFPTTITTPIEDQGVGTRGVNQALTLNTGFTNAPSGQAFSCFKDWQGQVRLGGLINHAGLNTPGLLGTLPVGKRPSAPQTLIGWGLAGGNYKAISVTVGTDGVISVDPGGATLTQLSISGLTFLTSPNIIANV